VPKRRWGYFVWIVAAVVIGVPEITAAIDDDALPFPTISEAVAHLERHHTWVGLIVIAVIVFVVYSTTRVPPRETAGGERTAGGRLTVQAPPPAETTKEEFEEDHAPAIFTVAAVASAIGVAVATWAATQWWDDPHHYRPAYVLYGSLALLWIVIPSVVAFLWRKDPPFPTAFQTLLNLEDWLRAQTWSWRLGPRLAWLVGYVVLAGLVILLLHLTLYPWPDIAHVLNPSG
jgi:hypothetical protein